MIELIVRRKYSSEERLTLDVSVYRDKELVETTWALNEASVEKAARQRMLEVIVEVDGRPLSRFGCDGVVCATPTGSTAYNFSAGGPIVWPGVEALLMVPISAHALFARPMVVAPSSVLAVEVLAQTEGAGVLWCDGRRTVDLPPGARIEVRRGRYAGPAGAAARGAVHRPSRGQVRPAGRGLARCRVATSAQRRLHERGSATGPRRSPEVIEEIRIRSLGVIDESVLELGDGLTVITGETGAGKTMLVTALGLLLGGRADTGAVRKGARAARVEGLVRADADLAAIADEHGGEVEAGQLLLGRQVSAEGRSRAFLGGASVPASALTRVGDALVAVHGQSDQHRLLKPEAQRDALDSYAGHGLRGGPDPLPRRVPAPARGGGRAARGARLGEGAGSRGRPAPAGPRGDRGGRPPARRGGVAGRPRSHDSGSPTPSGPAPRPRARRSPPTADDAGRPRRRGGGAPGAGERARARPRGGRARRPGRRGELSPRRRRGRRGVVLHGRGDRPRTPRGGLGAAGGADRPDQEVRRERGRGPRVGAGLRRTTDQPRRLRRAHRRAARRAGAAARRRWPRTPTSSPGCEPLRPSSCPPWSPASCTRCRCRMPGSTYGSTAWRTRRAWRSTAKRWRFSARRRRRGRAAAGREHRVRARGR